MGVVERDDAVNHSTMQRRGLFYVWLGSIEISVHTHLKVSLGKHRVPSSQRVAERPHILRAGRQGAVEALGGTAPPPFDIVQPCKPLHLGDGGLVLLLVPRRLLVLIAETYCGCIWLEPHWNRRKLSMGDRHRIFKNRLVCGSLIFLE